MREYGSVSPRFWIGETGKQLRGDPEAQVLALYLMTSPHANMIGIFHCPIMYMAHETGLPFEGASKALARLSEVGFCSYDKASETVFVHRMVAHQVGEDLKPGDNRIAGVRKEWEKLAPSPMKTAFAKMYGKAFQIIENGKPLRSPSKAPSKQLTGTGQEQEQERGSAAPCGFEAFWSAYPRKQAKKDAAKAWEKLNPADELQAKLLAAVALQSQSESWRAMGGKFIPLAATWLNGERWEDGATEAMAEDIFAGGV